MDVRRYRDAESRNGGNTCSAACSAETEKLAKHNSTVYLPYSLAHGAVLCNAGDCVQSWVKMTELHDHFAHLHPGLKYRVTFSFYRNSKERTRKKSA